MLKIIISFAWLFEVNLSFLYDLLCEQSTLSGWGNENRAASINYKEKDYYFRLAIYDIVT